MRREDMNGSGLISHELPLGEDIRILDSDFEKRFLDRRADV